MPTRVNQNRKYGPPNCFHWESRASGKGDTAHQVLEMRVVAQTVHAGIYMKIDEPVRALFVGFLEVFDRAVVFSQADVDSREEVRRHIPLFCQFFEIIESLKRFLCPAGGG